jgi:5-amino-6-(5-phosphoribosylamino)uracil reductase
VDVLRSARSMPKPLETGLGGAGWQNRFVRRLFPEPAPAVTAREAYGVDRPRPANRPWIGVCMVASLDGSTVVDGKSSGLSSVADAEVLHTLRDMADMIVVGAGTVRAEGYGPPKRSGQRIGVVTRTGRVDVTTPLFTTGAGFLILPEDAPQVPVDTVRAGHTTLDLCAAFAQLDVDFVQAEGGAHLNAALAEVDMIDELNLTISPVLSGGDGPRLMNGAMPLVHRMRLAHLLEDDHFLFTRYLRDH